MSDEPAETLEELLLERVQLECANADLKEQMQELEDEVNDLLWQIRYRITQNDVGYALDLIDRWN